MKAMAKRIGRQKKPTTAFHGEVETAKGSFHVVGIGDLRVIITHRDEVWFAQGLEINYAAQGFSLKGVKLNFERGLEATVNEHLRQFGTVRYLLKPTPNHVWERYVYGPSEAKRLRYSQVTVHKLPPSIQDHIPFGNISYVTPERPAA